MVISDAAQTLGAAFSLGILLQAAASGLLLYFKGHGSTVRKEPRRLALVLFLLFSLLWAQFDFINFLILPTAPISQSKSNSCQVTIAISSSFDQLARITIGGYLLWAIAHASKSSGEKYGLGFLVGLRVMAGAFFVGFVRPQFKPACVARSSLLPATVAALVVDGIVVGVLALRIFTLGIVASARSSVQSIDRAICRALLFVFAGFVLWLSTSITMILGLSDIILLLRTAVPSTGLMILVSIVTLFPEGLLTPLRTENTRVTPEARSPFGTPRLRSGASFASETPIVPTTYSQGGLFVVNPSAVTPMESPVVYPSGGVEDYGFGKSVQSRAVVREIAVGATPNVKNTSGGYFGKPTAALPGSSTIISTQGSQFDSTSRLTLAQQRKLFSRSNIAPVQNVRKLGISAPVAVESNSMTGLPFSKMKTIDLATAAAMDRKRREADAARFMRPDQPAPRPPRPAGPDGLKRSISTRRKELNSMKAIPPIPRGIDSNDSLNVNANASGSSLSPRIEDVRRRSPRTILGAEKIVSRFNFSAGSQDFGGAPILNQQNPLRSHVPKQQTVMFMNEIVYDQPGTVRSIIGGLPTSVKPVKKPEPIKRSSPPQTPHSSSSIMNRPRPYKRASETSGTFFKGESTSPKHKRSKSGSSVSLNSKRRSLVQAEPGNPEGLPSLPPLPTSAKSLKKLLPNDTRSMTVDEKLLLLFPAPLSVQTTQQRRSSVPSMPRIPSLILQGEGGLGFSGERESSDIRASNRASKRSTISFGTSDLKQFSLTAMTDGSSFNFPHKDSNGTNQSPALQNGPNRLSGKPYQPSGKDSRNPWTAKFPIPEALQELEVATVGTEVNHAYTEASSSPDPTQADSKSNWESLHSPAPAVEIQEARANAIHVRNPSIPVNASRDPESQHSTALDDDDAEIITMAHDSEIFPAVGVLPTFFLDASPATPSSRFSKLPFEPVKQWHHRLGDDLPSFSGRRDVRQRGMPPPPPLLLSSSGRIATVSVKVTEPAPVPEVIDSPDRAMKRIQAQLQRFEGLEAPPNMNSEPKSLGSTNCGQNESQLEGSDLLANLEAEMEGQENRWFQMQRDYSPNSLLELSPAVQELQARGHVSPPPESENASQFPSRSSSTKSLNLRSRRSIATTRSTETSSRDETQNSRTTMWQQRLAEAQMEFRDNASELQRKQRLNFLKFQNPAKPMISPSPPESVLSHEETEFDFESEGEEEPVSTVSKAIAPTLWENEIIVAPVVDISHLWTAPVAPILVWAASPEPPAKSVRPVIRKIFRPLKIETTDLWSKPSKTSHIPPVGLWGSKLSRPRSIITRPKAQRPRRRSRRATLLLDIVESPSPLPHNRGTLGIFRLPWGEKSEHAVYRPQYPIIPPSMHIPSAVINPGLEARSRELKREEYESSFFYDYDDMGDEEPDLDNDDFDESTLWEIANLLQSSEVPSRESLLPNSMASVVEREVESESEQEEEEEKRDAVMGSRPKMIKFTPIQPLVISPRSLPAPPSTWTDSISDITTRLRGSSSNQASVLSDKDSESEELNANQTDAVRVAKSRDTITLAALISGTETSLAMEPEQQPAAELWGLNNIVNAFDIDHESSASSAQAPISSAPVEEYSSQARTPTLSPRNLLDSMIDEDVKTDEREVRSSASAFLPSKLTRRTPVIIIKGDMTTIDHEDKVNENIAFDHFTIVESAAMVESPTSIESPHIFDSPNTVRSPDSTNSSEAAYSSVTSVTEPQAAYRDQLLVATKNSTGLWTARELNPPASHSTGLFEPGTNRSDLRSTNEKPAALATATVIKSKARTAVRSRTISVSAGRRGSALWNAEGAGRYIADPNNSEGGRIIRSASPEDMFSSAATASGRRDGENGNGVASIMRRSSKRLSESVNGKDDGGMEKVEEDKKRIEKEGQGTWRPKWGLPERPTEWLTQGGRKSSKVEFRY